MALVQDFNLGRSQRLVVTTETTFDTPIAPSTTNGNELAILSAKMTVEPDRKNRADARPTRSHLYRINGKLTASATFKSYAIPLSLTSPIDGLAPVLTALFGTQTISGGTSVEYTLSDAQNGLGSLDLWHLLAGDTNNLLQTARGWVVEEGKLSVTGADDPTWEFSGPCADVIYTGVSTTSQSRSGSETTVTVTDPHNFVAGSNVIIGDSVGSAADGHLISAVSGSTITFAPAIVGAQNSGVTVEPYIRASGGNVVFPTAQPIPAILGQCDISNATLGSDTNVPIVSFEVTVKNNLKPVGNEAFKTKIRDVIPGYREVTGNIGLILTRTQCERITHRINSSFEVNALTVNVGGPTGTNRLQIDIDRAEFMFSDLDVPEAEEVTVTIPFMALASTAYADEIVVTYY